MPAARVDIISIGTLSRNRIWGEQQPVRSAHATTSLIRVGKRNILVDPGLPGVVIAAKLFERTGLRPEQIDTIFLTNFQAAHRHGIGYFDHASKIMHEPEQQFARQRLEGLLRDAPEEDEDRKALESDMDLLETMGVADDKLAPGVDLFPLPGYTPGTCGLLISAPTSTLLIAGDAIATLDHFLAGQLLPDSQDLQLAEDSLREIYEIADLIVPGHDNIFANPRMQGL